MSENNDSKIAEFLNDNPRMTGFLFAMLLAVSQAGSAAAAIGVTVD